MKIKSLIRKKINSRLGFNLAETLMTVLLLSIVLSAVTGGIEAARKAYNALTADQKKKVSADTLKKLTDSETALTAAEKKAAEEEADVVMLIPARTDTSWFHNYIYNKAEITFLRGRLKFETGGVPGNSAPFPSMLVYFRRRQNER